MHGYMKGYWDGSPAVRPLTRPVSDWTTSPSGGGEQTLFACFQHRTQAVFASPCGRGRFAVGGAGEGTSLAGLRIFTPCRENLRLPTRVRLATVARLTSLIPRRSRLPRSRCRPQTTSSGCRSSSRVWRIRRASRSFRRYSLANCVCATWRRCWDQVFRRCRINCVHCDHCDWSSIAARGRWRITQSTTSMCGHCLRWGWSMCGIGRLDSTYDQIT